MKSTFMGLIMLGSAIAAAPATLVAQPIAVEAVSEARIAAIARESYDFVYPLVLMDITRRVTTSGTKTMHAPLNQFAHVAAFPPGDFKDVVRPNFDTLYSSAWLDVSREPVILSIGATAGRYYLLPLYDMWTDVFAIPGSETLGSDGGQFAITAPGWKGSLPRGVERIEAPTPGVWIIGRTQTNGVGDYPNVHAIQKQFTLTPLSRWGKADLAPLRAANDLALDTSVPPLEQVNRMPADAYFRTAMALMAKMPAHGIDQPMLARMRMIGLVPGRTATPSSAVLAALVKAKAEGPARLMRFARDSGSRRQGWRVNTLSIGNYGSDYQQRAVVAMMGLGANRPADAIYPRADFDSEGKPLDGSNKYVVHFNAGELPPVGAFWSLTAYDRSGFTVPNALDRYALGDRDPIKHNADGSLDLYLQKDSPGAAREANWLPIAPGPVSLNLRLYLPKPEAIDGRWPLPKIDRVDP